jgi:predicted RNA-binding Zn-ribbon protein involved in translation (DUF1610 family)
MSDLLEKCTVCQALVDEEDLFCANCGTEAPHKGEQATAGTLVSTHNFECGGCGASMSYDASAKTLRCPFCGSEKLEQQNDVKALAPRRVLPFELNHDQAIGIMRKWLGSSFWRPSDLASAAVVTTMAAVYVPYWVFDAQTFTYWTSDSSQTPMGAKASWYPVAGQHRGRYAGLLIGASGTLSPGETAAICPFDLAKGQPPDKIDLDNVVVEQFRVQRKYARPLAQQGLEQLEREACARYVPGRSRNMKVNLRLEGLTSEPVLVPVWMMAYRYGDRVYRFLANGQTGRCTGEAPVSWAKIWLVIVIAVLVTLMVVLGLAVCGGMATVGQGPNLEQRLPNSPRIRKSESHVTPLRTAGRAFRDVPSSAILARDSQQPFTRSGKTWPANRLCEVSNRRMTTTVTCARSGCRTWLGSVTCSSGWRSRSMPPANAASRWATFCSTARPVWAKPRSPCASRASWA